MARRECRSCRPREHGRQHTHHRAASGFVISQVPLTTGIRCRTGKRHLSLARMLTTVAAARRTWFWHNFRG
jgi:hypothetical protein